MPLKELRISNGQVGAEGAALRHYVQRCWQILGGESAGLSKVQGKVCLPELLAAALGERAEAFASIADRLIRGAAGECSRGAQAEDSVLESLAQQLEIVLAGLRGQGNAPKPANALQSEGRPALLQGEMWQLLHRIRDSGDLAYARETDLPELDRRILFLLRRLGELVPADVSLSLGVDKAQVSRSVKRLLGRGFIARTQLRSPLLLTATGKEHADRLLRLADLRDRELLFDIGEAELDALWQAVDALLERAIQLYEKETERAVASDGEEESGRFDGRIQIDRSRIVSILLPLVSYLARSGALSSKRLTGLSNFEAWVLSEISYDPPTDWCRLVDALQRDHSQAGRTVNALIERGLVNREGRPGRRHGKFSPTEEGARLYRTILQTGKDRERFLASALEGERAGQFRETFKKLRHNAIAQLERERAIEELARR